ncbi:MAG: zinc-binding alcohol dehydrogenase [Verrucomicrobiota bacterium]
MNARCLFLDQPGAVSLHDAPLDGPGVLVRSQHATFKHGTEKVRYTGGGPFAAQHLDPDLRLFVDGAGLSFPCPLGSMTVGMVEEGAGGFEAGERVYGWLPVADVHRCRPERLHRLEQLDPDAALCLDPATFALGAVYDGELKEGETVLITGLGAIGLLTVQACRQVGARVIAASGLPGRLAAAGRMGAEILIDSASVTDLAREVKTQCPGGVDLAIECSGLTNRLNHAVRAARAGGRVVYVGFYADDDEKLDLSREMFHNRISLHASLPAKAWGNRVRGRDGFDADDLHRLARESFESGRLSPERILFPRFGFDRIIEAVETMMHRPGETIKIAIDFQA